MLLRAISMLIAGRRDVADDEHVIAYSGPLVLMLSVVTVGDGVVAVLLHQPLPSGVRDVAPVLAVIALVWLVGFVASWLR